MRRTTLGAINSSQLNTRSSLGISHYRRDEIKKNRQSVGPGNGMRGSLRRISTTASQVPRPMKSQPRGSTHGCPRKISIGTVRRNSSFGARNSRADPRPVSDKMFMNSCIKELIKFLSERQYDHVLSSKLLNRPTKKDFCNIACFLFRLVDPNYVFGSKLEDDIIMIYKAIRYPFAISKTTLVGVGSPHSWPSLLASVAWVVELLSYDEEVQQADEIDDYQDGGHSEKSFFEYLGRSYSSFLAGDDDHYMILENEMVKKLDSQNKAIGDSIGEIEARNTELKKKIEAAKCIQSSLPDLQTKKNDYLSDLDKFRQLVAQLQTHRDNLEDRIVHRQNEIREIDAQINLLLEDIEHIRKVVGTQDLSPSDVTHMERERVRLIDTASQISNTKKDIQKRIWDYEANLAEKTKAIELAVQNYYAVAARLKLLPINAKNASKVNYEVRAEFHMVEDLRVCARILKPDLKAEILPRLQEFQKKRIHLMRHALDEALDFNDALEKSIEILQIETQNVDSLRNQIIKIKNNGNRDKQMLERKLIEKAQETEDIELKIQQIRDLEDMKSIESKTQISLKKIELEFKEMTKHYENQLQTIKETLTTILFACTDHKDKIESNIDSLLSHVSAY